MHLRFSGKRSRRLTRLLESAGVRLARAPAPTGTSRDIDGRLVLTCPLPQGWLATLNGDAELLRMRVSQSGHIFELAEVGRGIAGSLSGSCIPSPLLEQALSAWLAAHPIDQLALFTTHDREIDKEIA